MKRRAITTIILSVIITFFTYLYYSKFIGLDAMPLLGCILFYFLLFSYFVSAIYDTIIQKTSKYVHDILTSLSGIIMITSAMLIRFSPANYFPKNTIFTILLVSSIAFFSLCAVYIRKESKKEGTCKKTKNPKI